ncbi:head decoration protein [Sulfurivirga sp.]|uniref:head decoration protein n=1 Tax=Sulfurivirga sp. TaxID=2614236 RepID=UPI0025FBB47B|nr:head decoration protein [Sulfurivirga sp.]
MIEEGKRPGEFLISEGEGAISRDSVTLKKRAALYEAGTILGRESSTGLFKAFDPAATDGTQTAVGVLLDNVDASAANRQAVAITRLAEVDGSLLVGDVAAAKDDLAASHVIVR